MVEELHFGCKLFHFRSSRFAECTRFLTVNMHVFISIARLNHLALSPKMFQSITTLDHSHLEYATVTY